MTNFQFVLLIKNIYGKRLPDLEKIQKMGLLATKIAQHYALRIDFLDEKVCTCDGRCINTINFDNAATTPPIKSSIEYIENLSNTYASIGRGTGQKAEITTNLYKESKNKKKRRSQKNSKLT